MISDQKTTAVMLAQIVHNRHHAVMDWALNNRNAWARHQQTTEPDSREWHVAEVELAYWGAVIDYLRERAS